jgi:hypothetical protein
MRCKAVHEDQTATIPWDDLLADIHEKQILPVIGKGFVLTDGADGKRIPYADALSPRLAEFLEIDPVPGESLNDLACRYLMARGNPGMIYEGVKKIVRSDFSSPLPPELLAIASIRDFDLFINATFDSFLVRALAVSRPGYDPDKFGMSTFRANHPVDLPEPRPSTFVYNILGTTNTFPDFAVWEEDYLEILCGIIESPKDNLKNLLRELKNRSLLLIGSPFDDWIVRFFMRVAKQGRFSLHTGTDYLADSPENFGKPLVFYFDKNASQPSIIPLTPADFISELHARWMKRYASISPEQLLASLPEDMDRGSIFISYSRDDLDTVLRFAAALTAAGLPVWLDKKRLKPGGDWEVALKTAVKSRASMFLSLISRATESDSDRFVHTERQWAADMHVPGQIFYIPVVIDGVLPVKKEPAELSRMHRHEAPDGEVAPDFVQLLHRYLEQYRTKGEILDV